MLPDVKRLDPSGNSDSNIGVAVTDNNMLPDVEVSTSKSNNDITDERLPNETRRFTVRGSKRNDIGVAVPDNMLPEIQGLNSSGDSSGVTISNNFLPEAEASSSNGNEGNTGRTVCDELLSDIETPSFSSKWNSGKDITDNVLMVAAEAGFKSEDSNANTDFKVFDKMLPGKESSSGSSQQKFGMPSKDCNPKKLLRPETTKVETKDEKMETDVGHVESGSRDFETINRAVDTDEGGEKNRDGRRLETDGTNVAAGGLKMGRGVSKTVENGAKLGADNARMGSDDAELGTYDAKVGVNIAEMGTDVAKMGTYEDEGGGMPTNRGDLTTNGGELDGRKESCCGDMRRKNLTGGEDGRSGGTVSAQSEETICACERIDSALHTLEAELRAMRDQDLALLKQLIHINDNIRRLKRARWLQKAGRTASCGTLGARTRTSPLPGREEDHQMSGDGGRSCGGKQGGAASTTAGRIPVLLRQQSEPGFLGVPFRRVSALTSANSSFETINDDEDQEEENSVYGSATDLQDTNTTTTPASTPGCTGSPSPFPTPSTPAPRSPSAYTSLTFTPEEVWRGESSYGEILKRNIRLWKWSVAREKESGGGDGHPCVL